MLSDEYDELDRDPRVAENLAYLDVLIGVSLPPAAAPDLLTRAKFDHLLATARARADAAVARRGQTRRRWLIGVLAAAVTAAAVLIGVVSVVLPHPPPAYAATPQALPINTSAPGPVTLKDLTRTARALARTAGAGGDRVTVDHLITDQWNLNSIIDGVTVTSAVIPSRSQLWRTQNDAARAIDTYLAPQFPTAVDRTAWRDAGSPRGEEQRADYHPGEYQGAFHGRPPLTPDILAVWLARGGADATAILKGVTDLLLERALTAPERSAVLQVLATRTPLAYAGTTVDRAGRTGAAFTAVTTANGGEVTHVFVIDPRSGRILATEKILTAGAEGLKVRRPAVISYRTYLIAEQVPAIP